MSDPKITLDDIDEALRPREAVDRKMAEHFRAAGFTDEESRRGAELMASGRYFGFVDVATSLRPAGVAGSTGMGPVMEAAVQKIAAELAEARPTRTPWGRPIVESTATAKRTAFGRTDAKPVTESEMREVLERGTSGPGVKRLVRDWLAEQDRKAGQR